MALQSGEMIGPYRIVGQFGQGGMATVYKAYHPQLERNVAIKFLQQSYVDDVNFLTRFEREAKIIASLDHPNIVPVYDFNYFNGQPYLVMKSIEGVTLKEAMSDDSVTKFQILDMLTSVAAGLTYAHDRHVLHRDIKPSNILIDSAKRPYISDFGLARMTQASQSTLSQDMLMGTPHYMSPEQAKGTEDLTPATDIYSLGVILYEFAVGQVPFSSTTPYAVVHDHIYTPLPSPHERNPSVSPEVESVLVRALAKLPSERYVSAVEMLAAYKRAFTNTSKSVNKPPVQQTSAAQPVPSFTIGVPADIEPPTTQNNNSRKWLAAILVAVGIISLGVLVASNSSLPQLSETPLPTIASLENTITTVPTALASTSIPNTDQYSVPDVSIAQAQATLTTNPKDEAAYLSLAKASWLQNDNDAAQKAIQDGFAIAADKITFFLMGASVASEVNHITASLFLDGQALFLAQKDSTRYPIVRASVGYDIYIAAQKPNDINLRELERMNQLIPDFQQPALFDIMTVQLLIAQKRLPLAQAAYNRLSIATTKLSEAFLVHGELLQAQGNTEKAKKEWKAVLQIPDTPLWVMERVTDLINSN